MYEIKISFDPDQQIFFSQEPGHREKEAINKYLAILMVHVLFLYESKKIYERKKQ